MNWFSFVEKYRSEFGFTLFAMAGKKPLEKIKPWFDKDRSIEELRKFIWTNPAVSGIGIIMRGFLLCFDFDKVRDFRIVELFLSELGLDIKYKWIVKSGSRKGYHVYVNVWCKDLLIKEFGDKAYYFFYPIAPGSVDHIEIRLKNCYIVLPPSIHPDTKQPYEFLNGFPDEKPLFVNENNIIEFFNKYFYQKSVIKKQKSASHGSKNKIVTASKDTKYLNAAIDFIKKEKLDYPEWNKLCFALASLGEEGRPYFLRLSKNEFWNTPDERINQEFNHCLKSYDPSRSNLGTLFQYAMDKGFKHPGKKNNFSGIFYEFKLSVLQLSDEGLLIRIINYSMFRRAIEEEYLNSRKEIRTFIESKFKTMLDTKSYNNAYNDYKAVKKQTDRFEKKYGSDAYCRVGKEFFEDVLNKKFKMNYFRVLSAIYSILGKEDLFEHIGKDRILCAAAGYKSPEYAKKEGITDSDLIKESTLKSILRALQRRGFFKKYTFSFWAFYSTRLTQEELKKQASGFLAKLHSKKLERINNKPFIEMVKEKKKAVESKILGNPNKTTVFHLLPQSKDSQI